MYDLELLKYVEKMPVFSLADIAKFTKNRSYAKVLLAKLVKESKITKLMRNKYTVHENPLIFAPFLNFPAYISCATALSYHGLISQIPNKTFLMTTKRPKIINNSIIFHKTKHFFGFKSIKINGVNTYIAEPEKAFIDSIGIHPLSITLEALDELDSKKLLNYAKKAGELKRIGYLLKKENVKVSNKYVYLDPMNNKKGISDKKWKLIVNC